MRRVFRKILLTAAVAAVFPLFSGNLESTELFYNALKAKTPADSAALLIRAAKADPANSAAPLAVLLKLETDPASGLQLCSSYDKLWKENPADLNIACTGIQLFRKHRIEQGAILKNLKLVPDFGKSDGLTDEQKTVKLTLEIERLVLHLICGDNKDGVVFASKLGDGKHTVALSCFYNTMAYRCRVSGDDAGYRKMTELRNKVTEHWFSAHSGRGFRFMINTMKFAAQYDNQYLLSAIFRKLEDTLTDPRQLNIARITFAEHTRDYAAAVPVVAKLLHAPPGAQNHILFYAALRAGKFGEANKLLKNVPAKEQANAMLDIAFASCDPGLFRSVISSGKYRENIAGELKLFAASACKDKKLYYEARSALKDRKVTAKLANSIGYIATELGVDMDEAGKLLKFAVGHEPYNAAYLDSLAFWSFRQQLYAAAQDLIERAISVITPGTGAATVLEHAGDIYRAQGNFYQAEKCYKRALQFAAEDPECDPARVEKKLLEYR